MAELNFFGYYHGQSFVHRLDVRCKLVCLLLLTSAIVAATPGAMGQLSLAVVVLWCAVRLPLQILGREILAFLLFLLLVFVVRALATPGDPWVSWGVLRMTHEGVQEGGQVVWRLLMILVIGLVFIATTRPSDLKAAVQWLLRPIPFVPARKAATMVGLIVRFIPVLHQQMRETQNALAARAGMRQRPSWRQIRYLVFPTMRRVVLAADQLALAMLARGYQEKRTDPVFRARPADGLAVAVTGSLFALTLII